MGNPITEMWPTLGDELFVIEWDWLLYLDQAVLVRISLTCQTISFLLAHTFVIRIRLFPPCPSWLGQNHTDPTFCPNFCDQIKFSSPLPLPGDSLLPRLHNNKVLSSHSEWSSFPPLRIPSVPFLICAPAELATLPIFFCSRILVTSSITLVAYSSTTVMILCFAIFFLGHFATASDSSLCDYSCTPGGGCVVAYVGPSRFPFDDCCGFDGDDIYIMMQCLCVCHEKWSLPLQVSLSVCNVLSSLL